MEYHAPSNQFTVSSNALKQATQELMGALVSIRKMNNLPLTPYEREGSLEHSDHAQKAIIEGAKSLGINLGADWGNKLDLSEYK